LKFLASPRGAAETFQTNNLERQIGLSAPFDCKGLFRGLSNRSWGVAAFTASGTYAGTVASIGAVLGFIVAAFAIIGAIR
jgi:hypothetical protein